MNKDRIEVLEELLDFFEDGEIDKNHLIEIWANDFFNEGIAREDKEFFCLEDIELNHTIIYRPPLGNLDDFTKYFYKGVMQGIYNVIQSFIEDEEKKG